jgi:hypothetical protein
LVVAGVELPLGSVASVAVEAAHYDYEYDETGFSEEGEGTGLGAEFRFYPHEVFNGFYIGVGGGIYPDAEWSDSTGDSGDEIAYEAHGALGWMFRLSESVALSPAIQLGNWFNDADEAGFYYGVGLRLMFGF